MTNTLNLSTWSNRSHVSDAIPQNRLIQPSNFDYTITLLLSVRTLDSTEINPHISEASDIQFVASSVSVAGFRGYSVYVAGLFGLSMNYTNWLCGFTTALWIVYLDRMWYLLTLLCHWRVVVFSCLVIHIMSLGFPRLLIGFIDALPMWLNQWLMVAFMNWILSFFFIIPTMTLLRCPWCFVFLFPSLLT